MTQPRIYTALQFSPTTPEGTRPWTQILVAASSFDEARHILRAEQYLVGDTETYLLADWAVEKGPRCKVIGPTNFDSPTIFEHAEWVRAMTVARREDGEIQPATYIRIKSEDPTMTTTLDRINALITEDDRAALERCISKAGATKGQIRRTAPDWRKDPKAWAAWQAVRTALGIHGESATFTLMMIDDDARKVWDRVSDAAMAVRREIMGRSARAAA